MLCYAILCYAMLYYAQDCIEKKPVGASAYQVDVDMACYLPRQNITMPGTFDCSTMWRYSFAGVGLLAGCSAECSTVQCSAVQYRIV